MRSVLRSALARTLSFIPIAIATLLTSRLIIDHFGIRGFDAYALMLSLIFILPLNNLGVGTAITDTYASLGPTADGSRRVTLTSVRVLAVSTLITAAVSVVLGFTGVWSRFLGPTSGPSIDIGWAMAVYAVSFVPGIGAAMLLGTNRNHVTILLQAVFAPLILAGVLTVVALDAERRWLVILPSAATVLVSVVIAWVAARSTGLSWRTLLRQAPWPRRFAGQRIRHLSGPVVIASLATPIALQSDRIVLSHVSTAQAVAQYSLAVQIIAPALALVAASAQPLWPIFSRARSLGQRGPAIGRTVVLFCAGAAALSVPLVLVANPIAAYIGGDQVRLGILLPVAAAMIVVLSAGSYPVSMNLMNPQGVRFVAVTTVAALPINIGLSILLAAKFGAAGPMLATAVSGFAIQLVPGLLFSRRIEHTGRHRVGPVAPPDLFEGQSMGIDEIGYSR